MLAVIIVNVLLIGFVLVAIVGSHVWAIVSAREPQAQPATASPARARRPRRRSQTARALRGATAAR